MLQRLQTEVDDLNKSSQRLSDELTAQRFDVEVSPLITFSLTFAQTAYNFSAINSCEHHVHLSGFL